MRQAGIAAAGCLYALDHHLERLVEDHDNARALASGLSRVDGVRVNNPVPESNRVFFDASRAGCSNADLVARLAARGVEMGHVGGMVRAMTHLDVSAEDIGRAVDVVRELTR